MLIHDRISHLLGTTTHLSVDARVEHDKICTSLGHENNNWKVSSKSLENCRRSCGDKIVSTDGRTDGRTDEPKTIIPFDLRRGQLTNNTQYCYPRLYSSK